MSFNGIKFSLLSKLYTSLIGQTSMYAVSFWLLTLVIKDCCYFSGCKNAFLNVSPTCFCDPMFVFQSLKKVLSYWFLLLFYWCVLMQVANRKRKMWGVCVCLSLGVNHLSRNIDIFCCIYLPFCEPTVLLNILCVLLPTIKCWHSNVI